MQLIGAATQDVPSQTPTQVKFLHNVGTAWALRAPAKKLTKDRLPPVCWHSKSAKLTR